jgi:hypothetical protein
MNFLRGSADRRPGFAACLAPEMMIALHALGDSPRRADGTMAPNQGTSAFYGSPRPSSAATGVGYIA